MSQEQRPQLFTVHFACNPDPSGPCEIRGRVQHVVSGKWQYFRDWEALQAFFMEQAQGVDGAESESTYEGR